MLQTTTVQVVPTKVQRLDISGWPAVIQRTFNLTDAEVEELLNRRRSQQKHRHPGRFDVPVHCELNIIRHILQLHPNANAQKVCVGVSKPCCFNCSIAIKALRDDGIKVRGTAERSRKAMDAGEQAPATCYIKVGYEPVVL
ncbi:hypothetical protein BC832DRAFT_119781 [Gaertneriomyces semiglobifer]|nr:hypothetical protein BC832DRAFT_119781 [Gaertneriomyces semiglobifer]